MTTGEVTFRYQTIYKPGIIPFPVSFRQYYEILFTGCGFMHKFWNSFFIASVITILHIPVSLIAGFTLAKVKFKGRVLFIVLYVLVMLMPYSVTILPNYIQAKCLGIYDTHAAVVLPAVFAPQGAILIGVFSLFIDDSVLEAVSLETKSLLRILVHIVIPILKPAITILFILTFAESWNMVEQPYLLLEQEALQPLSVLFRRILDTNLNVVFAATVFYMVPVILGYLYCEDMLEEMMGIKQ
ncbi:MAG: binding-protein-dependent transport system inner rane component [Herbinix sp.]|jgi:multiple sugar transport system permease protein|nr:binding-protein-dependent transport system inner rane component [Herbinix sp.]